MSQKRTSSTEKTQKQEQKIHLWPKRVHATTNTKDFLKQILTVKTSSKLKRCFQTFTFPGLDRNICSNSRLLVGGEVFFFFFFGLHTHLWFSARAATEWTRCLPRQSTPVCVRLRIQNHPNERQLKMCHTQLRSASLPLIAFCRATRCFLSFFQTPQLLTRSYELEANGRCGVLTALLPHLN